MLNFHWLEKRKYNKFILIQLPVNSNKQTSNQINTQLNKQTSNEKTDTQTNKKIVKQNFHLEKNKQ